MRFIHGVSQFVFESYEQLGGGWLMRNPYASDFYADGSLRFERVAAFTPRERTIQFAHLSNNDYANLVEWVINEVNWGEHQFLLEEDSGAIFPVRLQISDFDFREVNPSSRVGSLLLKTQGDQQSGPVSSPMSLPDFISVNPCAYPSGLFRKSRLAETAMPAGGSAALAWGRSGLTLLKLTFNNVLPEDADALGAWVDSVVEWNKSTFSLALPFWSGTCRWWSPELNLQRQARYGSSFEISLLVV